MARIAAGDEAALGVVYDRFSPLVFGIAVRMVGEADAADICQDVFCTLWERHDRFDAQQGTLSTFLGVIARRRCVDLLRSRGRRHERERRVSREPTPTPTNVEDTAEALLAGELVRAALFRLPAEQRDAIELAYFKGMSYRKVATALGIAEGTAKSRIRLALSRLAGEMADWGNHTGATEWA